MIAAFYARGLIDYLRARGLDPATLLTADKLTELDTAKGHAEVSMADWVAMLDAAIAALDEPALPAQAGASLHLRHLGVLGHVLMNCATLEEVYSQLARYIRLLGQIGQPVLTFEGEAAHLLWQWPYDTPAPGVVAQFMLAARANFMRWLSGRSDLTFDVHFHFARPTHDSAHAQIFGGVVRYGQPHSKLVFPRHYLALPVVAADEGLRRQVEDRAQALLATLSGEQRLMHRLQALLGTRLANGHATLDHAAAALGITARTLQRRLSAEGESFQSALDAVRRVRAETLLREGGASLSQIAFLLGYTEQSTFQNAFRRWTGVTPGEFRKQEDRY
ncbi:MAG: AraC family transcriptional regulator [Stagnimonas sp.]|nr:AraC family transcriptional regulator [Stagnimonas sp.]